MQDEVNTKVVALAIRTGTQSSRITAQVLREALKKFLQESGKMKNKTYRGKQSVGKLMKQNVGLTNIEITEQNIKSFERIAKKYHIDFALKKDKSVSPPRYLVFFKARDVDVMTVAFKEFTADQLENSKKSSIRKMLYEAQEKVRNQKQQEKVQIRDRGHEW